MKWKCLPLNLGSPIEIEFWGSQYRFDSDPLSLQSPNKIKCEAFTWESQDNCLVLVLAFDGTLPPGSEGNNDANFMGAVTRALTTRVFPDLVVFDLRNLEYTWGDYVGAFLDAPRGKTRKDIFEDILVVSDKCRPSLEGLFSLTISKDFALMFDELDQALCKAHELWAKSKEGS